MNAKTAVCIKRLDGFTGEASLYRLSQPISYTNWLDEVDKTEYVVVSAIYAMLSGPEAFIFPANETGDVLDWGELPGSYRGGLDHGLALQGLGFTIEGTI